jgi:type II secretory pathway pseudopilin PulG
MSPRRRPCCGSTERHGHKIVAAAAEPRRRLDVVSAAVEVAMGFSLLEISIVMACISLLGFLIADNLA